MTIYQMTTITTDTRRRTDHSTASPYLLPHVAAGKVIEGDELFIAPVQLSNASGVYQLAGDKWLHVTKIDDNPVVPAGGIWIAYIHKGQEICNNFKTIGDPTPNPDPNPVPVFPDSFTLTDPGGAKAEYKFIGIISE